MQIIPAVDLKGGKCVRLIQGEVEREIIYDSDPVNTALHWVEQGATRLHLIDLDGALEGRPVHVEVLSSIAKKIDIPIQFGGGIRNEEALKLVIDSGASFVILGTTAVENPEFVKSVANQYPGQVILSIDSLNDQIRVSGWKSKWKITPEELAENFLEVPLANFIITDISRDGMLEGFDSSLSLRVAEKSGKSVIAAGGITDIEDIKNALPLFSKGLIGVVVGRALYEKTLDFKEALEIINC
tara:strand:- start:14028 stop:14753 length:726 start_codon:yes stop_codon:yes gene_type:complete